MITGDKVKLLDWKAAPNFVGQEGVVRQFREVGLMERNISYEYLVRFGTDGPFIWVPARYLVRVK